MSAQNFNTQNGSYRQLVGNGLVYRIPPFQRDYSWGEEEWDDLWTDILGTVAVSGEPAHYMGYLVLQTDDGKVFDVIDGQQRLTTLSLIVLAALKHLDRLISTGVEPEDNRRRLEQMRQTYIGYLDPITLQTRSKLTLNRNNETYYQNYIVSMAKLPKQGFKVSEHLLRKSFEWFERAIDMHVADATTGVGRALATLVETMSERLFFTVITVTDELNAYKVFETLNSRGVRLSATDLLKNYLFTLLHREGGHEHEMRNLEDRWEGMIGRLGSEDFPDFLRIQWNSRNKLARKTDLFKVIRNKIVDRAGGFRLLREMDEDIDGYLGLTRPDASELSGDIKTLSRTLRMFNVRQPHSMLLAARRVYDDGDFADVFRAVVAATFRYNVIVNGSTSDQERRYDEIVQSLASGEPVPAHQTIRRLAPVYPSDDVFRAAFAGKSMGYTDKRNRRVVRYILCELENMSSAAPLDFENRSFNIEHVLPVNPETGWDQFSDAEAAAMVHRLGNMTLMASGANADVGTAPFEYKRAAFAASAFAMTRRIAEDNDEWTPARIEARQNGMANKATSIWRIAQLP